MAKCPICNARKGKRKCQVVSGDMVCSLCCGTTRQAEPCSGCHYYQPPKRDYNGLERYSPEQMDRNPSLQSVSLVIERAIGTYDNMLDGQLKDDEAITIYELLIDRYHFGDETLRKSSGTEIDGAGFVNAAIKKHGDIEDGALVKILGVLRHVARRRTSLGREYMAIVHQFTG